PDRVLFVTGVMSEHLQLCAIKLPRPVALFTCLLGRTEIVHGCGNGTWIGIEGRGKYLSRARQFRAHIPGSAGTDMTVHTSDTGVRGKAVRGIFGTHYAVTKLPAKLD